MVEYKFYEMYECDYMVAIATIKAKDLHSAMVEFYKSHSNYDIMEINGEWY